MQNISNIVRYSYINVYVENSLTKKRPPVKRACDSYDFLIKYFSFRQQ